MTIRLWFHCCWFQFYNASHLCPTTTHANQSVRQLPRSLSYHSLSQLQSYKSSAVLDKEGIHYASKTFETQQHTARVCPPEADSAWTGSVHNLAKQASNHGKKAQENTHKESGEKFWVNFVGWLAARRERDTPHSHQFNQIMKEKAQSKEQNTYEGYTICSKHRLHSLPISKA